MSVLDFLIFLVTWAIPATWLGDVGSTCFLLFPSHHHKKGGGKFLCWTHLLSYDESEAVPQIEGLIRGV